MDVVAAAVSPNLKASAKGPAYRPRVGVTCPYMDFALFFIFMPETDVPVYVDCLVRTKSLRVKNMYIDTSISLVLAVHFFLPGTCYSYVCYVRTTTKVR